MMASNDEVMRDIAGLKKELGEVRKEMTHLRRALIGSYDTPGGLAIVIERNRADVETLRGDFFTYRAERERLVEEFDGRVSALEKLWDGARNKAIGIVIGIGLGSAGIGAGVATVISNLMGP